MGFETFAHLEPESPQEPSLPLRSDAHYAEVLRDHPSIARVELADLNVFVQYGNHSEGEPVPETLPVDAFALELAGINFAAGTGNPELMSKYAQRFTYDIIEEGVRPQLSEALARAKETGVPVCFIDTPSLGPLVSQEHAGLEKMDDHRYLQAALSAGALASLVAMVQDAHRASSTEDAVQKRSFTRRTLLHALGISVAANAVRVLHMAEHAPQTQADLHDSPHGSDQEYRRNAQYLSEMLFKDRHLFGNIYRNLVWAQKIKTAQTFVHAPDTERANMFLVAGAFHTGVERALRMDEGDRLAAIEVLITQLDAIDSRYVEGTDVISILQHGPTISDALCDAGVVPVTSVNQWQFAYYQDPGLQAVLARVKAKRPVESSQGE